ncbi:MAG: hypothetical protein M3N41_06290 [Acidobacteriota bacterium]|nr:hypothetical protein [Acidobacteriota bacterium]
MPERIRLSRRQKPGKPERTGGGVMDQETFVYVDLQGTPHAFEGFAEGSRSAGEDVTDQ